MKNYYLIALMLFFSFTTFAQNNFWSLNTSRDFDQDFLVDRNHQPTRFEIYDMNFDVLKTALQTAPERNPNVESTLLVSFPVSNGKIESFKIYEASVMHPDLASQYPNIKSYVGFGTNDKTAMIRFSTTLFGFHGYISSGKSGDTYIDTYTKDLNSYIVYNKKYLERTEMFECLVEDEIAPEGLPVHFSPRNNNEILANTGIFRTYRLALACTVEYANFHVNAAGVNNATTEVKKAAVLAAMNVTLTRINGIYERDMSLTMQLVPNNDLVIFIDTDNFDNNNSGTLINQSQTVINSIIGFFNYDIGHTVSTGGGGLAQLNAPCSNNKARGITGQNNPVGDPFDIDFVAHEMGHQFGATHTFNNFCNGNRSNATAVETGSGSTIMSYAGICPPNVQGNSDAKFHAVSLAQMDNFVAVAGNCSNNQDNNNEAPVINPIPNYTIPSRTPFFLPGNATDANTTALTYSWEQTNTDISTQPPLATNLNGPSFRSLPPSDSPIRYMPNLPTVLNGSTQNAWEAVPNGSRTMNFALVVRDNQAPLGGQTARRNMTVTTSNTGLAFAVTSQNTNNITWIANESQLVTWEIADTNIAPINTQNVKILLSIDGGQNFDIVLAESTPNDGSENITVPNGLTSQFCRLMIQGANNIFYNVNEVNFSIGLNCEQYSNNTVNGIADGVGANTPGATTEIDIVVDSEGLISSFSTILSISHTWLGDLVIDLQHPDGTTRRVWNRNCNNPQSGNIQATFQDNSQPIACGTPTTGTFNPFESFNPFINKPKSGTWKLRVTDFFNGDTGSINSWTLDFGCSTLSQSSFSQNKFSIYPNPSNGQFTIKNDFSYTNDTKLNIYDMSGRLIHNQSISGSEIETRINLNGFQTGAYLLILENESFKETHRIVIQ